jgi:REP element-mobilizing transposase RayT
MGNNRESFEPGIVYHVYNHGNADDLIFKEDTNYDFFLQKYQKYIPPIADTFAYCLLPNHFHFMIRVKERDKLLEFFKDKNPQGFQNPEGLGSEISNMISHQFGTFLNSYTKAYNKYYDRKGSLFRNTFKRKPITYDSYYTQLIRYIHLNPIKHGFVDQPHDWVHSSYRSMLSSKKTLLKRKVVIDWFGGKDEFVRVHRQS